MGVEGIPREHRQVALLAGWETRGTFLVCGLSPRSQELQVNECDRRLVERAGKNRFEADSDLLYHGQTSHHLSVAHVPHICSQISLLFSPRSHPVCSHKKDDCR